MKSADLLARNFGRRAVIFEELEVIELLRAAVVREGSQTHFARRHGIDRVQVNRLLKGRKMNVTAAIAKALGLRMVFAAE
jgi:DNA-binding phage protein